jgi:ATP-dependent DNA helicase RecQ
MTGDLRRAAAILKSVFGYDSFRPGQAEIIGAVLAGKDVFAVMPTGSGKSLCYQLPAIVEGGLTVVVSPLIALMRDQVGQMAGLGVAAATLNSHNDAGETDAAWRDIERGDLRLLFVSPERLAVAGFVSRLGQAGLKRLVIDEAHCVSQWGHDFRPEYRMLTKVRATLGGIQTLALTATADDATRTDIAAQLFEHEPVTILHSFDRPNLDLRFSAKDQPRRQIEDVLARNKGSSGIVYTSSRDKAERLAEHFGAKGFRALAYHAGLDQRARTRNQDAFLKEDGVVMFATVAFGMGINKPDVRFVVHADMPGGIEAYYQEIGRAGRDGLPAETLTLYGVDDMVFRRRQIAEKEITPAQRRIEERRLSAMLDLCESALCRRQSLLAYFGEASSPCGTCDLCRDGAATYDATIDAQKLLSAVARTGERFGAAHLADVLTGEISDTVKRLGHDGLKTFGVGKDRSKRAWQTIARQLFAAGALAEASAEHGGFCLTEKGADILRGRETVTLRVIRETRPARRERGARQAARLDGLEAEAAALFEQLRALRLEIARAEGIAAYMVFADRTLIDMAQIQPRNLDDMRLVHGVGEAKLAKYGARFLGAVRGIPS